MEEIFQAMSAKTASLALNISPNSNYKILKSGKGSKNGYYFKYNHELK